MAFLNYLPEEEIKFLAENMKGFSIESIDEFGEIDSEKVRPS